MEVMNKATRIDLFSLKTPQMRAFHMSWFAFFLCFFAWFGIAPLMAVVSDELGMTKAQVGNTIIASVSITILARFLIGWLCDRMGEPGAFAVSLASQALGLVTLVLVEGYPATVAVVLIAGKRGLKQILDLLLRAGADPRGN